MKNNITYLKTKIPQDPETAEKLAVYFENAKINPEKELNGKDLENVFKVIFEDYLNYKIDPDTLGYYSEKIVYTLIEPSRSWNNSPSYQLLSDLAELEVSLRHSPDHAIDLLKKAQETYDKLSKNT